VGKEINPQFKTGRVRRKKMAQEDKTILKGLKKVIDEAEQKREG